MSRFQEVKDKLRVMYGMVITRKEGEFRVNYRGGTEDMAYYTSDLADAFATGVLMSASTPMPR